MTKKDYTRIADTILSIYMENITTFEIDPELLDSIIDQFAGMLKEDNSLFSNEQFKSYIKSKGPLAQ